MSGCSGSDRVVVDTTEPPPVASYTRQHYTRSTAPHMLATNRSPCGKRNSARAIASVATQETPGTALMPSSVGTAYMYLAHEVVHIRCLQVAGYPGSSAHAAVCEALHRASRLRGRSSQVRPSLEGNYVRSTVFEKAGEMHPNALKTLPSGCSVPTQVRSGLLLGPADSKSGSRGP